MAKQTTPKPRGRPRAPRPPGLRGELGAAIERERKAEGWTVEQLAAAAGLGKSTILDIEAGRTSPAIEHVLAIAEALGTTGQSLMLEVPSWKYGTGRKRK